MFLARRASAGFSARWRPFHQVQVTSRSSTAPTLVQHVSTKQTTYLSQGQTAYLRSGDQICLLCTNPDLTITVMSSKSSQQGSQNANQKTDAPDEPQRKRTKLEHPSTAGTEEKPLGSAAQTGGAALKSIMLMLIGLPGSGKSTFSKSLMKESAVPWVHINQDTVGKNGKAGTRQMCLKEAKAALTIFKNCVMDRSNLTVEQRQDFVQLCQQLCSPVHAVVLNLNPTECSARVVDRTDHPTGVQGKNARGVVFRMNHEFVKAGSPQLSEGLSSIRICNTPEEVQETLDAWVAYGPSSPTPPPNFGLERTPWQPPPKAADSKGGKAGKAADAKSGKAADAKAVKGGGIMGLFSKQAAGAAKTGAATVPAGAAKAGAAAAKTAAGAANVGTEQNDDVDVAGAGTSTSTSNAQTEQAAGAETTGATAAAPPSTAGADAATTASGTAAAAAGTAAKTQNGKGTEKSGNAKSSAAVADAATAVAGPPSTAAAEAGIATNMGNKKEVKKAGDAKTSTAAGKVKSTEMEKVGKPNCKPPASPAAKEPSSRDTANTAAAKAAKATTDEAAYDKKSRSLEGKDEANADKQTPSASGHTPTPELSQSMGDKAHPETPQGLKPPTGVVKPSGGGNAFAMMMKAAKSTHTSTETSAAGGKSKVGSPAAARQLPGSLKAGAGAAGSGGWQGALKDMALHPERHSSSIPDMYVDSKCVCIPDKYPKARHHILVVTRDAELDSVLDLKPKHLELLQHLKNTAQEQIDKVKASDPSASFQLGFHSIPSMSQLHLHVISTDFDSASLKNKKHWNSFTTPFFLHLDQVVQQLQEDGAVQVDAAAAEALLKQELRCHRCKAVQKTIPALKAHIAACKAATA